MKLELTHYQKALEVFLNPEFEEQDLWLHDWIEECYKSKPTYTENGIHWGYTDALVSEINEIQNDYYGFKHAYVMDHTFPTRCERHLSNSRFSKIKFKEIKSAVLKNMEKRITDAIKIEDNYQKMKKEKIEVEIHPVFDGKWYLVKYADNWADEMDIQGFMVLNEPDLKQWKKMIPKTFSFCLGTNEEIEYTSKKDFLGRIKIEEILVENARLLFNLFSNNHARCLDWNGKYFNRIETYVRCSFGFIPTLDYFFDRKQKY